MRFWRPGNKAAEEKGTDPPEKPLWTDDALDSDSADDLDRKRFADMVAARINACVPSQNSAVFGLVGPWGSGKTTLINFIRARLDADWQVAVFSSSPVKSDARVDRNSN
ncbi:P-loop NTPase fold protein [Mycobacterium sp. 1423905.2]|uniref:P-loop NTPase fold protein n=1 Tax=Mycobacterium sp. 1423905.2 TaxID=1856859 RepID=UPI0012EA3373|nr:P-loop NTPase fold protein [Mycobacterium sp. 1423905.2]